MEALHTLGIDWKLLIAQVVNFIVLLYLLNRFLYKPVLGLMETRSKHIKDSIAKAQAIDASLEKTKEEQDRLLSEARREAKSILDDARSHSEEIVARAKENATAESERIIAEGARLAEAEAEHVKRSLKSEIGSLAILATERVLRRNPDAVLRDELQKEAVKHL